MGKMATEFLGRNAGKIIENRAKRLWNYIPSLMDFPEMFLNLIMGEITKHTRFYYIHWGDYTSVSFKDKSMYEFYSLIKDIEVMECPIYLKKRVSQMNESINDTLSRLNHCLSYSDYYFREYKDGIINRLYIFYNTCESISSFCMVLLELVEKYRTYAKEIKKEKERLIKYKEGEINEQRKAS